MVDRDYTKKIKQIRNEIRSEYMESHDKPWIIGFSGGKDSMLIAHLVVECILSVAPDERRRKTYIVYNDTLVESPIFQNYVERILDKIADGVEALKIPVEVVKTKPKIEETFWVNLLGKGYPAPNRSFRWCMDRLKIEPTSKFIKERISESGEVILLLGIRKAESAARAQRLKKYSALNNYARLSPNKEISGCMIFRPIMDLSTENVWDFIKSNSPPWGGRTNQALLKIYREAGLIDPEGSFMVEETAVPDSSSILARFGCWTCTVIDKDRSLEAFVESGYKKLQILIDFRNRLRDVSDDPDSRSKTRRNGRPGLGPLTFEAREMLLKELLRIQKKSGLPLISTQEIRLIKEWWAKDKCESVVRKARKITQQIP